MISKSRSAVTITGLAAALAISAQTLAADIQSKRQKYIAELVQLGVLQKVVKPAQLCHAWTGIQFDALAFDHKQQFIAVVHAWCVAEDPKATIVVIKDGRTGKDIGTYSATAGGLRLK